MKINKKQIAYNRSTRTQKIKYIVIHDTGNPGNGANSESHFNYWNGGNRQSSADFVIDKDQVLQINDYFKYYTWHCGDGSGKYGISNANSIGIEICINSDGDYDVAWNKTVELTQYLMWELGLPATRVVRHYDASRKNCPATMSANNWAKWDLFKSAIINEQKQEGLTMDQYNELKKRIDELSSKIPEPTMIYAWIDDNMPDWARPTIEKLYNAGYLKGDEQGRLNLDHNTLRILVILDRAGAFKQ